VISPPSAFSRAVLLIPKGGLISASSWRAAERVYQGTTQIGPACQRYSLKRPRSEATPPPSRASIFVYRCSNIGISPEERATYQYLLASRDFHDSRTSGALDAVGKMTPYWKASHASYHWVEDETLSRVGPEISPDSNDCLVAGLSVMMITTRTTSGGINEDPFIVPVPMEHADPSSSGTYSVLNVLQEIQTWAP
jgi:hypothetical protein